jgi:hypothetical protein
MAIPGKRITALAAVIALTGAEIVPVVQSGEAKSATVAQLRASAGWVSLADYPTLQAACAAYSAPMDQVAGQATINLPCTWHVYLTMVGR